MEDLIILYNLPAIQSGDYDGFLASLSRKEGALHKRVCLLMVHAHFKNSTPF